MDLSLFVGITIGAIFYKSGNIIYCILFHSVANSTFFVDKIWLLYINILLFPALIGTFMCITNKKVKE